MALRKGKIISLRACWGSGLAMLHIKNDAGQIETIPCDNGPTMRALDAMFPNFICPDHTVDLRVIIGKEVLWDYDDMGLCLGAIALPGRKPGEASI